MKYVTVEGRKLSQIAMGTDHFDETISKETAIEELDYYVEHDGNVIDTAHLYSQEAPGQVSRSEALIGLWLKSQSRNKLFVVTKGCCPPKDDFHQARTDLQSLRDDVDSSIESLGTEVNLWYFHRDNPEVPADELIDMANEEVLKKGYARYIGASNWTVERIAEANAWAKANGKQPFALSEIQGSLATTTPEQWGDDTLVCLNDTEEAWYRKQQFPIMVFSSQAKGYFSKLLDGEGLSAKAQSRFDNPGNRKKAERVKKLSKELGVSPAAIAIAYMTSLDHPVIAIVGSSKPAQIADTLSQADLTLTEEQLAFLRGEAQKA